MRKISRCFALTIGLALCTLTVLASDEDAPASKSPSAVTPTSGESWIHHLHRSFGDTSMGKTGRLGPPPPASGEDAAGWQMGLLPASSPENITLHGADLYRLNCQGCHGEAGLGAPPEIHSVIDPVRATSVPLILARMKKSGMDMSSGAAAELARQSQNALLQRLHSGGEEMPSFSQLNDAEVRALIAYLNQLAGVPGAKQLTVTETPARIGELIVKSTCHTCHDATGPNPSSQELEDGTIPPLETLTTRVDQMELIRKVTNGAPITMGTPPTLHRGRMPVFFYLSKSEAADVYLYLTSYPPSQSVAPGETIAGVQQNAGGTAAGGGAAAAVSTPPPLPAPAPPVQTAQARTPTTSDGIPDWVVTFLLIALGGAVATVIAGGMGFAAYELTRLGRQGEYHNVVSTGVEKAKRRHRNLVAQ
jgi:mono/diheme cytochrome c family protein